MSRGVATGVLLTLLVLPLASCARSSGPTPVCTFDVTPASHSVPADGGARSVNVGASAASCTWTIAPGVPWITVVGATSRTGSGTFDYTVATNAATDARTGTIVAAGVTHTVTQTGQTPEPPPPPPCDVTIAPASSTMGSGGGTGTFSVTVASHCDWSASSDESWLRIDSGSPGSGNGVIAYRADANVSTSDRTGHIAVADKVFTLRQDGADTSACAYTVSPVDFTPCMPAGSVTTHVTTAPQCPWTVTSTVPWLTIDGGTSRTGSGDVRLQFGTNFAPPRDGVVEVRWPTVTAGQNVRVAQAGCLYATSVSTVAIGASGGSSSFNVLQQAMPNACGGPLQDACVWTASATVPWITITTTMPVRGDNPVAFTVAANPGNQARTGTIVVQDRVVTVQQAGAP